MALLDEQSAHGFTLARAMAPDGDVGRVWAMRRPLVFRALDMLQRMGLVRPAARLPSDAGPQRTILEPTSAGRHALAEWLAQTVEHIRDTRSLLMLKLLFLSRRGTDPAPLLRGQRERFTVRADRLTAAAEASDGFDRNLLLWRLHSTTAAIHFTDAMLKEPVASGG